MTDLGSNPSEQRTAANRRYITGADAERLADRIVEAYQAGESAQQIAKREGISRSMVEYRLKKRGMKSHSKAEARKNRVVEAYQAGKSVQEIAQQEGLSYQTIRSYLMAKGIRPHRPGRKPDPEVEARKDRAVAAYLAGDTTQQKANREGVSRERIRQYLESRGVQRRRPSGVTPSRDTEGLDRIVDAYQAGQTIREIADREGLAYSTIRRYLKDRSVQTRSSKDAQRTNPELEARISRVVEAYQAGEDAPAIAEREGVTSAMIYRYLERRGVPRRSKGSRHIRSESLDRIVAAYQAGESTLQIADREGVSYETVRRYLKKRGVSLRPSPRHRKISHETVDRMVAGYRAGDSLPTIARREGINVATVYKYLKDRGVQMRRRKDQPTRLSEDQIDQVVAAYRAGDSMQAIAMRYGVNRSTIKSYLTKRGVHSRSR